MFIIIFFSEKIILADDSHKIASLIFSKKKKKNVNKLKLSSATILLGASKVNIVYLDDSNEYPDVRIKLI